MRSVNEMSRPFQATTFLFFGTFGFNFFFNMIFTYRYCRMLEENSFRGRTADFVMMFLFGSVLMILFAFFVNLLFLGQAFTIMVGGNDGINYALTNRLFSIVGLRLGPSQSVCQDELFRSPNLPSKIQSITKNFPFLLWQNSLSRLPTSLGSSSASHSSWGTQSQWISLGWQSDTCTTS